ncbi:MAG: ATP-binding cassette domain-containing protein [Clostridia bacterium]|nr:ATP-binding cassette domain-containing protein [Clostridia bacterium]
MLLQIDGICKKYGRKNVLNGVHVSAAEGECVGVIGKNGCGKSTLLSIIAGVCARDGGSVLLDGKEPKNSIGYVPQGIPLIPELSAWDNLRMWYSRDELLRSLECGVCQKLGINDFIKLPVYKMSGGMKKRLSICCSMANDPQLMLMDEATAALDIPCKRVIFDYLTECKKQGKIILLTTHSVEELDFCDRIYVLKDGIAREYPYNGDISELAEHL